MEEKKSSENHNYYEAIIKKNKTGITFPKELREKLFPSEDDDYFFKLIVPQEKDKIVLRFLTEKEAELYEKESNQQQNEKDNTDAAKNVKKKKKKASKEKNNSSQLEPNWSNYFVYDFSKKEKVKQILESAYYKFAETPIEYDDALGRVKYALVSFLTSTKTENAKLFYSVVRFLIDIIKTFDLPRLIDWIYEKVIQNIESKFLYELALIDMIPVSIKYEKYELVENSIDKILTSIHDYSMDESYNIMNSFKQLVKKVRKLKQISISTTIFDKIKESLIPYMEKFKNNDYKIQIIESLEDLGFIEDAYTLADNLVKNLDPDSVVLAELRKIRNRLKEKPL
ncbi:MAG: hypothetical protein GF311_13260 [Candidatus Lokiarchaeota archaeon]|nr:hypothetical protein [Candidatus Lokiarchaeota archaeon]